MYESKEIRQVWAPEKRYAVISDDDVAYWAAFYREGSPAGILSTDGTTSLDFRGQNGETEIAGEATDLILVCASAGVSPAEAFNMVKLALEQEYSLTSEKSFGPLIEEDAPSDTIYSISVDGTKVVALVEEAENTRIRVGGEWEETTSDDPRVFDIPIYPVAPEAVELWDDGKVKLKDYAKVLLDDNE